jgi:pimeloyl-ACP methyl ester carboxylesterase
LEEADDKDLSKITLLLLPGLDGSGYLFANLLPELPKDMDVITLAFPARQFLPYSDLVPWLASAVPKNKPYVLLAESYASPLAVRFAATDPPNLAALIISVGFISNPVKKWGPIPRLLARPFFFQFQPPAVALKYFIAGFDAPESLIVAVRRAVSCVSVEVFVKRARAVIDCDATKEIREVRVSMLYLHATEDRLVGKASLDEIKRLHPKTISTSIRSPHLLLQREPRIAARAITQFLDSHGR